MEEKEISVVMNEQSRYHAERVARIHEVVDMLQDMWLKRDIKREISEKYGVSPRTVEDYITEARVIVRAEAEDDLKSQQGQHVAWHFNKVRTSRDETVQQRSMHAIAKVFGLYHADRAKDPVVDVPLPETPEDDPIQELSSLLDDIIPEPPE